MQNVEMSVKGQKLTIEIDLSKRLGPSKSGKTTVVATTNGNVEVPQHLGIKIGVNCYTNR
jgi:hypothetical protein